MISLRATKSWAVRTLAAPILFGLSCMILAIGCGESGVQESSMPSKEFADKLEKEHPELFVKKVGKKTEVLGGRDKRAIIRQEWDKAQKGQ